MASVHGGELQQALRRLGCRPGDLLDASASLAPWTSRLRCMSSLAVRHYPDRTQQRLISLIAAVHGVPAELVLPGNGAAELFTWAARDAAEAGLSVVPAPGFADYGRALRCWHAKVVEQPLPLTWAAAFPQPYPPPAHGEVVWICNPHNPTGQLWSRASLEPLLSRHALVICDEAFLPLVPDGERQSLIPLVAEHPNLVVVRSLTKLYGIAGVRLGYAISQPERLQRWAAWRDPWPVNGIATELAERLLQNPRHYRRWCQRVQAWTAAQGACMQKQLSALPGINPLPSAANFLLIKAEQSLVPLREAMEQRHQILLRDCRSFSGLGERWLRIGLQSPRQNRRIIRALKQELRG